MTAAELEAQMHAEVDAVLSRPTYDELVAAADAMHQLLTQLVEDERDVVITHINEALRDYAAIRAKVSP